MPPKRKKVLRKRKDHLMKKSFNDTPKHTQSVTVSKRQIVKEMRDYDDSDSDNTNENIVSQSINYNVSEVHESKIDNAVNKQDKAPKFSKSGYNLRNSSRRDSNSETFYGNKSRYKTPKCKSQFKTPMVVSAVTDFKYSKKSRISNKDKEIWTKETQYILNKTWKICYLSTIQDFNYNTRNLKKNYESVLLDRISSVYSSHQLSVSISTSSVLSQIPNKVDIIIFKVTSLVIGETMDERKYVTVYDALLIKSEKIQSKHLVNQEWFPLMLYAGIDKIHNAVINWLQSSFGCYVTPKCLPQSAIMWLSCIYSKVRCENRLHASSADQTISFQYLLRLPDTEEVSNAPNNFEKCSLLLRCNASDMDEIWNDIVDNSTENLKIQEIVKFNEAMDEFLFTILRIPSTFFKLAQMKSTCVCLSRDGRIRLTCDKKFASMIKLLIEVYHAACDFELLDDEMIGNLSINDATQNEEELL